MTLEKAVGPDTARAMEDLREACAAAGIVVSVAMSHGGLEQKVLYGLWGLRPIVARSIDVSGGGEDSRAGHSPRLPPSDREAYVAGLAELSDVLPEAVRSACLRLVDSLPSDTDAMIVLALPEEGSRKILVTGRGGAKAASLIAASMVAANAANASKEEFRDVLLAALRAFGHLGDNDQLT